MTGVVLRPLGAQDLPAVQDLIDSDPAYVERVEGRPPTADDRALLAAAPAGWEDNKLVLGAFVGDDVLVAVVDLLPGFPASGAAHIGLLQVHARHQGHGFGRSTHNALLDWVRRHWPETEILRAAIVATNATTAGPFWSAMGYLPTGHPLPYDVGAQQSTVQIWTHAVHL